MILYNKLNLYLKNKYGKRTLKIPIDCSLTCPNRDGIKSYGGCIFCSEQGSGENRFSKKKSIKDQLDEYFLSYKAKRADYFIIYLQSFSNTYGNFDDLKKIYYEIFNYKPIDKKIVGISIATRPDCIDDNILSLINDIKNKANPNLDISIELGFQNFDDNLSKILNKQYYTSDFINACKLIKKYNFNIIAHIMLGLNFPSILPDLDLMTDLENTINLINNLEIDGIKIHGTYVIKNTKLYDLYKQNKFVPITSDEYMKNLLYIISHLKPSIVVHRIKSDPPKDFIAPLWMGDSKIIINSIDKYLEKENLYQGIFYNDKN